MACRVEIKNSAVKEIAELPKRERRRVLGAITGLADEPPPEGVRKLTGSQDGYRVRVGDYRIVYQIADPILTIFVVRVGHPDSH